MLEEPPHLRGGTATGLLHEVYRPIEVLPDGRWDRLAGARRPLQTGVEEAAHGPEGTVVLVVVTPGTVLGVAPGPVAVVVVVIAGPGAVVDVVLVVGAAHCDRSTIQPAQRAQSGVSDGIAVPASHTATDRSPAIGHSQVSAQSAWTMPSPQYPVQLGRVEGGTKVEVVVVVVVVVIVDPPLNVA